MQKFLGTLLKDVKHNRECVHSKIDLWNDGIG